MHANLRSIAKFLFTHIYLLSSLVKFNLVGGGNGNETMDNKGKDATEGSNDTRAPKRVARGIIVKAKKKKKTKYTSTRKVDESSKVGVSTSVPSILTNIPTHHEQDNCNSNQPTAVLKSSDEFDDTAEFDNNDVPSDALLCFQTLTQSTSFGGMSETCAYCPIYTHNEDGSGSRSTTAVPFLPRHVLLYMLNKSSTTLNTNTRTHIEQEIKQLAVSNKVRLLQLHGTAMFSNSNSGSGGFRGDGNDDEDVAIMEFSSYNVASKMALEKYFQAQQSAAAASLQQQHISKVDIVHTWYTTILLPYFAGKTWFSASALDDFYNNVNHLHSLKQMEEMIQQLVHAGVLMPRRGVGPSSGGGEGYWFSLPGLGKAAKSIVDGRTNLLRRLQSSLHKEKKRSTLEFEIGRIKSTSTTNKNKLEQAGKFVVLDMLAKGLVDVHKTCTGEQFIRMVE